MKKNKQYKSQYSSSDQKWFYLLMGIAFGVPAMIILLIKTFAGG